MVVLTIILAVLFALAATCLLTERADHLNTVEHYLRIIKELENEIIKERQKACAGDQDHARQDNDPASGP